MTRPPARLEGHFARKAPVCIVIRRGPTKYSQLIRWQTDTDEFQVGQWIRGSTSRTTLSSDGIYMATALSGLRSRLHSWEDTEASVICKPPYFTALEACVGSRCFSAVGITLEDEIYVCCASGSKVIATNPCPLKRISTWPYKGVDARDTFPYLAERLKANTISYRGPGLGTDHQGRSILFKDGCIFADGKLLLDVNGFEPENCEPPEWATRW